MSMVLRKVWELVSNTSRSNSDATSAQLAHASSSSSSSSSCLSDLGALEQLPGDVLLQILRLLRPKDAAKLSTVCKALRSLVSDNRLWVHFLQTHQVDSLWESVFFAETSLSYGYPLP